MDERYATGNDSRHSDHAAGLTWGRHAVLEALTSGHSVNRIYLARDAGGSDIERIKELAGQRGVRYDFVDVGRLGRMAGTRAHQDVVARLSPVAYANLQEALQRFERQSQVTLVAMDRIQHAGNVGLIVRTAVGAGADALLLPNRGGRMVNDEVIRASAGTVYRLPIVASANLGRDLLQLKQHGFWIYGLDREADQTVYDVNWPERLIVVAGNETSGLRPLLRKSVDAMVSVPLCGGLDSLNVAVALGIVLFEMRRATGIATGIGRAAGSGG